MIDVVALVTVYNPNRNVVNNLKLLSEQVERVILCDNSVYDNLEMFAEVKNSVYTTQYENLGLTGAFNSVLKDSVYGWKDDDIIVFFDQDSRIDDGYIEALYSEYQRIEKEEKNLGCLGPIFYNTSNGKVEKSRKKKMITSSTYSVSNMITSSLMTRYKNLKKIGFWYEELFLDMADWDLCWRMQAAGMDCCMTEKVILRHSIGEGKKNIGPFELRVGQPLREYYQTRDCIKLLLKMYTPLRYKIRFIAQITIRPIVHILFYPNRRERCYYIKQGFLDYQKKLNGEVREKI